MSVLLLLWWITFGLCIASLVGMVGLILQRAWRNRSHRRSAERRRRLQRLALELVQHPPRLLEVEKQLTPADRRLLVQVYDELYPKIRGEYAERLVSLMRILGIVDQCLAALKDSDWLARTQAARMLGMFRDPNVTLALYRAVEDPVPMVRIEAARSLARLGEVRSVLDLLRQIAPGDDLPSVPVMELFRSMGRKAVPSLVAVLQEPEAGIAAKLVAVDALGHIGDLSAVEALLPLGDHPSLNFRLAVTEAFGRLGDPRALAAVLLCMTDPAWEIRAQAARAAGRIGSPSVAPMLGRLLTDDHWWTRYYAAEALFRLGAEGLTVLREAAVGDHAAAAQMAAGLLQEKGVAA
jgi:hypothetical protein